MESPAEVEKKQRDILHHLESYLSKRDGVDKLLKISRYASKIIISSSILQPTHPLSLRLKTFESNVGLSRKAFRLGKFIQDVNSLRSLSHNHNHPRFLLALLSYGGEGVYYFIEQIVWLSKSGLIHSTHARNLQKLSAWAEFLGYIGSITLKLDDLFNFNRTLACLDHTISIAAVRGDDSQQDLRKQRSLKHKILMKKLSILQDLADALMAIADIRDSKGVLSSPLLLSSAGLLSALISTHKNWISS